MPRFWTIVLYAIVTLLVAGVLYWLARELWRVLVKLLAALGRLSAATLRAFATGGLSLFTGDARKVLQLDLPPPSESLGRLVLNAFATGGVSLLYEPARPPPIRKKAKAARE